MSTKEEELKALEAALQKSIDEIYAVDEEDQVAAILGLASEKLKQRAGRYVANVLHTGGTSEEIVAAAKQAAADVNSSSVRIVTAAIEYLKGKVTRQAPPAC